MKRTVMKWGVLLAAIGATGMTACAAKDEPAGQQEPAKELGKIEFKLSATTPQGVTYRLRDAIIMIQGPEDTLFFDTEENLDSDVWRANVPPGDYTYFIQEGWRMERLGDAGDPNVGAQLTSPNPGAFQVFSNSTVAVPLRFRVGEGVVSDGAFEVSIEVTEEDEHETVFCTSDEQCASGETCCSGGFLGTCMPVEDSGACPLPDLVVVENTAANSMFISRETFGVDSCALAEQCVNGPGERRLLKFATETANIGPMDVILGNPSEDMGFEFSSCHGHFHFEGYAAYELKDAAGEVVATGHKQAFCLLDSNPVGDGSRPPQFHCGFQGITSGWSDVYGAGLDCQWVDITDVPNGDYVLSISINPERAIPESNYDNNVVQIPVVIGEDPGVTDPCPVGGPSRNCGWIVEEDYTSVPCEPGTAVTASCGCDCDGDPVLRACADPAGCTFAGALATSDDSCGLCSQASFQCPANGEFTLLTGAYGGSGGSYSCDLQVTGASSGDGHGHDHPEVDAGQ